MTGGGSSRRIGDDLGGGKRESSDGHDNGSSLLGDDDGAEDGGPMPQKGRRRGNHRPLAITPWMSETREPSTYQEPSHALDDMAATLSNTEYPSSKAEAQMAAVSSLASLQDPQTAFTSALVLKNVYGYAATDRNHSRSNVKYAANGSKVVYYAGAVGVVLDKQTKKQVFNLDHAGCEICAMAVHACTLGGGLHTRRELATRAMPRRSLVWAGQAVHHIARVARRELAHERRRVVHE